MESNEIFGVAEAALGRVRSDVEALQSELSLRQQLLRRRKRALAGKERALERTRKAWEAADQEVEQAEEETAAKLTEITGRRNGSPEERGRRRRASGERDAGAEAPQSGSQTLNQEQSRTEAEHFVAHERAPKETASSDSARRTARRSSNRLRSSRMPMADRSGASTQHATSWSHRDGA